MALRSGRSYANIARNGRTCLKAITPGPKQRFQWIGTTGELALMSLASNRFLRIDPRTLAVAAASPGRDGRDGTRFVWPAEAR